jgi:hypothetical protein
MKATHQLPSGSRSSAKAALNDGSPKKQRSAGASKKKATCDCDREEVIKVGNKGPAARGKAKGKTKATANRNGGSRPKAVNPTPAAVPVLNVTAPAPLPPAQNEAELRARMAALESRYNTDDDYNEATVDYEPRANPLPPVIPGKAIAVLDLTRRSNLEAGNFGLVVAAATTASPYAAGVTTTGAQVLASANKLMTAITAQRLAMEEAKMKTQLVDQSRVEMEALLNALKGEVQFLSQGDAAVIESFGLMLKRSTVRVGELPSPLSLLVGNGPNSGMLMISWAAVAGARGYVVQCAEGEVPTNWENLKGVTEAKMVLSGLTPGKTYHFRVAAFGGTSGQSAWSPAVARVCS